MMTREEKIAYATRIMQSQEWTEFLKPMLETELKYINTKLHNALDDESTNGTFLNEGKRLMLEWVINTPQRVKDQNQGILDRLYDRLTGGNKGAIKDNNSKPD